MGIPVFTLSNGMEIPCVGFGTSTHVPADKFEKSIEDAIDAGYRYIDTASFYETERAVGRAVRESGIDRSQIQIATKVWYEETGYQGTKDAIERSLERLNLDYIDIYLIHWPKRSNDDPDWKENAVETWKAMEEYYHKGLIKALGLSNFLPHHLDVILENCEIKPVVDQLELHLGYTQEYAASYAKEKSVQPQAWSPIGRAKEGFTTSIITGKMAEKYGVSRQKLGLKYLVSRGYMVLPCSTDKEHMKDNLNLFDFEISKEDMSILSCMPQEGWLGEHPDFYMPITKHVNLNQ